MSGYVAKGELAFVPHYAALRDGGATRYYQALAVLTERFVEAERA